MAQGETKLERSRRHVRERISRGAVLATVAGAAVALSAKYLPNTLTSESVKPPTTTEQVLDNTNQNNPPELKIAK